MFKSSNKYRIILPTQAVTLANNRLLMYLEISENRSAIYKLPGIPHTMICNIRMQHQSEEAAILPVIKGPCNTTWQVLLIIAVLYLVLVIVYYLQACFVLLIVKSVSRASTQCYYQDGDNYKEYKYIRMSINDKLYPLK